MSETAPDQVQRTVPHQRRGHATFALLAPVLALGPALVLSPRVAVLAATSMVLIGSVRELRSRPRADRMPIDDFGALEHQLARWRRRGEAGSVLMFDPAAGSRARQLVLALRTTDAVALCSSLRGPRLVAALDDAGLDRRGLERRLGALGTGRQRLGWASFPADGTTLEALLSSASAALEHQSVWDEHQRPASPRPKERPALPVVELASSLSKLEKMT